MILSGLLSSELNFHNVKGSIIANEPCLSPWCSPVLSDEAS